LSARNHERRLTAGDALKGSPAFSRFRVGVAGWSIPKTLGEHYPATGSHLERYAASLPCVEINSSFYRHHQPKTYARWAASVPSGFRFSVKLAREFTHDARLAPPAAAVKECLAGINELGATFGVLLIQLPPSLAFEAKRVEGMLRLLRDHCPALLAWEPRHRSWASEEACALLEKYSAAKVIADPEPCSAPRALSSDRRLRYYRLHGSPEMYRSSYGPEFLARLAAEMENAPSRELWCVFDNTTLETSSRRTG
jgi:uncharacterized protein YecE (DUF72 family)